MLDGPAFFSFNIIDSNTNTSGCIINCRLKRLRISKSLLYEIKYYAFNKIRIITEYYLMFVTPGQINWKKQCIPKVNRQPIFF